MDNKQQGKMNFKKTNKEFVRQNKRAANSHMIVGNNEELSSAEHVGEGSTFTLAQYAEILKLPGEIICILQLPTLQIWRELFLDVILEIDH